MSTYSQAWHDTPPATRDFYRNFHRRYTAIARRIPYDETPPEFGWFTTLGWSFHAYSPFAIAMHNWAYQYFTTGAFHPATVALREHDGWSDPSPGPPFSLYDIHSWADQFVDIPDYASNYPKPAINAPRSYWTGKPRHRRNHS